MIMMEGVDFKDLIEELASALSLNIDLYDLMIAELAKERAALKNHSLAGVEGAVKAKTGLAVKISTLEKSRQETVRKIAEALEADAADVTLTGLVELLGGADGERLLELRDRLRVVTAKVSEMNDFNRGVIERSMRVNYQAASVLQELVTPENSYDRGGQATSAALKPGRVVNRKM